jgi:hypothetical protein
LYFASALLLTTDTGRLNVNRPMQPTSEATRLRAGLERLEYTPTERKGVLRAPNRAQGVRLTFGETGVSVEPREGGPHLVSLGLTALGRTGDQRTLGKVAARVVGSRVERSWGGIVEWFLNQPDGLEHGWTVSEKAQGSGPLVLSVAVVGAHAKVSNNAAVFESESGRVLHYGSLKAFDVEGAELTARMIATADGLQIEVNDTNAHYPVVVDPLLVTTAWAVESNRADARYGSQVASAGDVNGDGYSDVLVAAYSFDNGENNEGGAFLYLGSATGLSPTPAWTVESNQANAFLGGATTAGDVNGDGYSDVVVSAGSYDNGQTDEGIAWLYLGSSSGLSATPSWVAESDQAGAGFGNVACAGDVNGDGYSDVVVGALFYTNDQPNEGRAFLYLGSATGLSPTPAWTAESNQASPNFGTVASAGDVNGDGYSDVLVGANFFDNGEANEGRVFLYLGSVSGLSLAPAWTAESNQAGAWFGGEVASAGDVNGDGYSDVVIGALNFDNGEVNEGGAFLFLGSATGLSPTPAWTGESDQTSANFGNSVGCAGDVNGDGYSDVMVSAPWFDNGETDEGRAFLYLGSAGGLSPTPAWMEEGNNTLARFGSSRSAGDINGDGYSDVVVGAVFHTNGELNEGKAVLYLGNASGLTVAPSWMAESNQSSANFGSTVASAGDVNGDGYSDVLVGAERFDNGELDEGRAFLYLGSQTGVSLVPAWTSEGNQAGALFGTSVASAGDVNGDGYSDVVVGARNFDNGQTDEGAALLYLGSASGLGATPTWTAEGNQAGASFGSSVASAGDVNGDGYADLIVGVEGFDNGEADEGGAVLYLGSASGLGTTPAWAAEGNQTSALFGNAASAGDVNGDGFSDVLVGARLFDNGQVNEGRVFLYLGSGSGLSPAPAWPGEIDQASASFGWSVASAGDVNGDGYSDVVVGAPAGSGRAFLYLGSSSGLSSTSSWTGATLQASAAFGTSVSSAGDVNGDGYSDVVVGARFFDNGQIDEGRAFLYLGSASGLGLVESWTGESDLAISLYGSSVASAGDVNGDGFADVLVGAPALTNGEGNEGRAFLYWGGDRAPGLPQGLAQQFGSAMPAGAVGRGMPPVTLSVLGINGLAPQGRVVLETEVKPLGVRFNGGGLARSSLGVSRQRHAVTWSVLPPGLYHWRARLVSGPERGRWLSYGGNSETEADFVIVPFQADAGVVDGGQSDAGPSDAGAPDAGEVDAGVLDAGDVDAGVLDAGDVDAGVLDAGDVDAGVLDAGEVDAGALDAGDVEVPDAGEVDGGTSGNRSYIVGCGCGAASDFPTTILLLLVWNARRPRRSKK